EPEPEAEGPDEPDGAEDSEGPSPAGEFDQVRSRGRGGYGPEIGSEEQGPLRPTPFLSGEPSREHAGRVRDGPRLAGAEEKPNDQERYEPERGAGQGREERPPDDNPRQHAARTKFVPEPPRRHFEEPIRYGKSHQHIADLRVPQAEFLLNRIDRLGHADAIEIEHPGQSAEPRDDDEAGARRTGGGWKGHAQRLYRGRILVATSRISASHVVHLFLPIEDNRC